MQKRLTQAVVEKMKADPSRRIEVQDELVSGLRLRISPLGRKSWSLVYKVAGEAIDGSRGENKRMTFGAFPYIDLKAARERCYAAKDLADRGIDPVAHHKMEIEGRKERRFDRIVEKFIELHAKPSTKKWQDTKRLLDVYVVSALGQIDVSRIDRAAIHALLDGLVEKNGTAMAREVRKHLSTLFNWCVDRGIIPFNPMAGMKRRDLQYVSRSRVLSMRELQAVWQAAGTIGYPFGPIIQMLILSGQRRSEIANLQRNWISSDYFEIPAENYKTGVSHVVPLTAGMADILSTQPIWNAGDFVFSTTAGKTPSSGFSKVKRKIDKLSGVSNWTFHDIRRSVSTHMAEAGVIQEHIERVLGHAIPGVAGTYNRYSYLDQKRQALKVWGKIVDEKNLPLISNLQPTGRD